MSDQGAENRPKPAGIYEAVKLGILSGNFLVFAFLGALSAGLVAVVWKVESEYIFSLGLEFGVGLAFFLCFQQVRKGFWDHKRVGWTLQGAVIFIAVAALYDGRTQSLLVKIGCSVLLFVALDVWVSSAILRPLVDRQTKMLEEWHQQLQNLRAWQDEEAKEQLDQYVKSLNEAYGPMREAFRAWHRPGDDED